MSEEPRVDVLLAKSYDPDVRVRREVTALASAGYRVRIIAWDRTGQHLTAEDDHGVPIHRVRVRSRLSRGWTQIFFLARVAFRILPLLREGQATVLHVVNLPMLGVAVALAPLLGRPRPLIVYDAFEIHALMGADRYPAWLVRLIALAERVLPRFADLVITPGEDRRRYSRRSAFARSRCRTGSTRPGSSGSSGCARQAGHSTRPALPCLRRRDHRLA